MPKQNESTMQWKLDIAQFKKNIVDAKRQISLANAEFKTATAGIDNWAKSITGVEAKIKQLATTSKNQKTVLTELEKQYAVIAREMGEDSTAAQKLKLQIENQKAAIAKTTADIEKYNVQLDNLQSEQKESETAFGKLNNTIEKQQNEVEALKQEYANAVIQFGKNSDEAKALASQIESLSGELAQNKTKMNEADRAADDLDKSLDDAGDSAKEAANGGFTILKGTLANLAAEGITHLIDGMKELGRTIIDTGKQSIASYAEFEQLEGGVKKLFGDDAAKTVMNNANKAFSTAGMSANNYMDTVTSFSASLIAGLNNDTAKAAEIADIAIRDMSDNANTFGTDITSLQHAYQSFAKGSFTLLDNLKLGFGGTQAEMARLINESGVLGDTIKVTAETVKDVPFSDIILAINETQKRMGIFGTTSNEAATTIEGSTNSMKAAWSNLLTELAKSDGNVDAAFDTLVKSIGTVWKNLKPRIKQLVNNAVQLIGSELRKRFPKAMKIFDKFSETVQTAFSWIVNNGDTIITILAGIAAAMASYVIYSTVLTVITKGWLALAAAQKVAAAAQAALNAVMSLNPIGLIIAAIAGLIAAFVVLWNKSEAFRNFWIGLWEKIQKIAKIAWEIISGFFSDAWTKIQEIWTGVSEFFGGLWESIKKIFSGIATWIDENVFQPIIQFFQPVITFFAEAWAIISELATGCWEAIKAVWEVVSNWFNENIIIPLTNFFAILWTGIKTAAGTAWNEIKSIWQVVSSWFDSNIISPVKNFFSGMWNSLKTGASLAWEGIKSVFSNVSTWFKDKFSEAWSKVKAVFSVGGKIFDGIKEGITSAFKTVVNAIIRGINKVVAIPFNAINNMLDKIRNVSIAGFSPFSGLISRFTVPQIPELARGGVLKRGQVGLLEGDGAEAVVPLEQNKKWIAAVVKDVLKQLDLSNIKRAITVNVGGLKQNTSGNSDEPKSKQQIVNFNQTINSPKAIDRLTIYRETNSLLFGAKVRLNNV